MTTDDPKVKAAKKWAGGTMGAGALVYVLITYVDARLEAVTDRITQTESSTRQYVDGKHQGVKESLDDIKKILAVLDSRLYDMSKNLKNKE